MATMSNLNLRRFTFLVAFFTLVMSVAFGQSHASEIQIELLTSAEPNVTLLSDGLALEWHLPDVVLNEGLFEVEGFQTNRTAGRPMLPSRSVGVAIPLEATPVLQITELGKTKQVKLSDPIPLAPMRDGILRNEAGEAMGSAFAPAEADPTYSPEWVTFEEIGTMAGVRLGRLTVHPILPKADNRYELARHIKVHLDFQVSAPTVWESRQVELGAMGMLSVVSESVINAAQIAPQTGAREALATGQMADLPTAIIETDGTAGMIELTYAELAVAGFPVDDSDLNHFHLYRGETEIAWRLIGSGAKNDRLEAAESLIFYAPGTHSRWTVGEVFRLVAEEIPGLKMANGTATPSGLPLAQHTLKATAEEDLLYTAQCLCGFQPFGRDGDRWMWQELKRPGAESADFEIETPNFSASAPAQLTVWLIGVTDLKNVDNDHLASIYLNGTELGQVSWGGKTAQEATLTIPAGLLQATNQVTVTLEETGELIDWIWVDAFEIEYAAGASMAPSGTQLDFDGGTARSHYEVPVSQPANLHLYDLTDPDNPVNLLGFSVSNNQLSLGDPATGPRHYRLVQDGGYGSPQSVRLAQSLLTRDVVGATYIIVTPAEFSNQLNDLFALRSSQGYSVVIEEAERIYDQFGYGEPNPAAIKDYLNQAWDEWAPQPDMVLLVGDGHYDPRQNFDGSPEIKIPPFLLDIDPDIGETAVDNRFVTFDGPDDQLPEMKIGRLPVNTVEELQGVLQKVLAYDSADTGIWSGNMSVIGDHNDPIAGDFPKQSNRLINHYFPRPWLTKRFYLAEPENRNHLPSASLNAEIKERWNRGNGLVMYTGHSSIHQWAVQRVFHIDDVESLSNVDRLPVVMGMTCFTSSFHYPEAQVLDESLLLNPNGGAVATWGATGLGVSTGHDSLANGFLNVIFQAEDDDKSLGEATVQGKLRLAIDRSAGDGNIVELLDTFTLLGDPATQVRLIEPHPMYLPSIHLSSNTN